MKGLDLLQLLAGGTCALLVVGSALVNIPKSFSRAIDSNSYIFSHWNTTYDQRMLAAWKGIYAYAYLINRSTEPNSTIAIPPQQRPWLTVGNGGIMKYFLYPRFVINGEKNSLPALEVDYVLMAIGDTQAASENDYGWPKFSIESEGYWQFNLQNGKIRGTKGRFDPTANGFVYGWGVIKL